MLNYGQIAIFDNDSDYANSLADYFRLKGCISSQIIVFTKIDSFKDYAQEHSFDILLINHEFLPDISTDTDSFPQNFFILCEHRNLTKPDDTMYLFKYTSADDILRQVMTSYRPVMDGATISFCDNHKCNIIGIYSPVNRCGKTSFALALALHFSLTYSCVFISFDNFSTINSLIQDVGNTNNTIDDLLYYFTGSPKLLKSKLLSFVKHIQQLDVIAPSEQTCAIAELNTSERLQFIQSIADTGRYDYIFMDIGNISPAQPLFKICQRIYIPAPTDDTYSDEKINLFMASIDNLTSEGRVLIKPITLPVIHFHKHSPEYLYSLTSGDMKHLVASLVNNTDIWEG